MTLVRRVALISLLALAFLVPRQPAPAATGDDPVAKLDSFITKALKEYQVPGAAIAVVQDGKAYVQAGAGIVADSVPATEYEETLNKARGMLKAIEITQRRT